MSVQQPEQLELIKKFAIAPPAGKPHGVAVTGSERPGRSPIFRHHAIGDGPLLATLDPKVQTQHDAFEKGANTNPNGNCLGWREHNKATNTWSPYQWWTYETVRQKRNNVGAGLVALHSKAGVCHCHNHNFF